eukprot:CAMPEP_0182418454 /NCGR_PEP_ID=MMETSP1167-20130531/2880_1 /TAXON_ID=2988 /ORGANISM="Mallomonas Sp, Strain CCMP3275" /LENGTH=626 /DNA_ID=CAMNT_0024592667 /DNA_START=560 /DNA_END=2440 /DNA_ORIENTATION=+
MIRSASGDDWTNRMVPETYYESSNIPGEATVLHKNETFMLFPSTNEPGAETLIFDHVEVSFRSNLKDKKLILFYTTKEAIMTYLTSKSYLAPLLPIVEMRLGDTLKNQPVFRGLSSNQLSSIGPLMRVICVEQGQTLTREGDGSKDADSGLMGVLLYGSLVTVDSDVDVTALNFVPCPHNISARPGEKAGDVPTAVVSPVKAKKVVPVDSVVDYSALGQTLHPGDINAVVGVTKCLYQNCTSLRTVVASSDSVVGLLSRKALVRLAAVRSPILRTMQMNLVGDMLTKMRSSVQLLRDITDGELRRLAGKVDLQTVQEGEVVYREGEVADKFFMIYTGEVKRESKELVAQNCTLGIGSYFGEASLVTASERRATVTATKRSLLISVDANHFRSVFDAEQNSKCEAQIRLIGESVDLIYIIRSTKGYGKFMKFLEKEHSTEGLLFWQAVDRFEDMCERLTVKTYHEEEREKERERGREDNNGEERERERTVKEMPDYHMLHEMAACIMKRFILDGAVNQVNIQGNLRKQIEKDFASLSDYTPKEREKEKEKEKEKERETNEATGASSEQETESEKAREVEREREKTEEDERYKELFKKAKSEVYGLLKTDNLFRWKDTPEFTEFLSTV